MSKLTAKKTGLLQYFEKPRLTEFLLIMVVFILISIGWVLVHTLQFRCFKTFFSMKNFHIRVEQPRCIFKCNNYPVNIIGQCIKKFLDKLHVPKQIVPIVTKKKLLTFLAFLGKFSINLRTRLKSVRRHYRNAI